MPDNLLFYKRLKKHAITLERLLSDERLFENIPADWYVIVVDIENSTQAIKNDLHQEVNLAATGSIVTVLNEIKKIDKKIRIPYFFGGDGATFILPKTVFKQAIEVLENFRHHVKKSFFLTLKVGSFPIAEIYAAKHQVKIARLQLNKYLNVPIVLGAGLKFAEKEIKSLFVDETNHPDTIEPVDLEGMECRWQEIAPPKNEQKVVCLLVNGLDENAHAPTYHAVVAKMNAIFGSYKSRQPISPGKLKLDLRFQKIQKEMYARIGKFNPIYLIKNWFITAIGKYYFKYFKKGKEYVRKVSQRSYTVMVDGTLNNVFSGTQKQIDTLVVFLDKMEAEGKIQYGIHVTHSSVMSCYVEDRNSKHIHFVDGTEGGYTSAAKVYKAKLGL